MVHNPTVANYGYSTVPKDIEFACAQLCANALREMVRSKMFPDLIVPIPGGGGGLGGIIQVQSHKKQTFVSFVFYILFVLVFNLLIEKGIVEKLLPFSSFLIKKIMYSKVNIVFGDCLYEW